MKLRTRILAASAVSLAVVGTAQLGSPASAQNIPNCGGQNAAPQPATADHPYVCNLPFKKIDGTFFGARVEANGSTVKVTIALATPRTVDTPARIVHHQGVSGAGLAQSSAEGVIPAGQQVIVLTDSEPCRDGQLDVKVWHVENNQPEGRIGGPNIQNGTGCVPDTTAPPTTTPSGPVAPGTPGVTAPSSPGVPSSTSKTLPATGGTPWTLILVAVLLLSIGSAVVLTDRRTIES